MTTVSAEPGINACASPCRTTGEIALVLSRSGDSEVYVLQPAAGVFKRLTYSKGVDSSPSFSPDGKRIAFVSDRDGNPQIYIMNRDGFQTRRISYLSNYCTSPAWSPDGNYIAYVFRKGGYGIALYELNGEKTIIAGEGLGSEEISWASDSRHIVYSRIDTKPSILEVFDIFTKERRRLMSDKYGCFSPSWSF